MTSCSRHTRCIRFDHTAAGLPMQCGFVNTVARSTCAVFMLTLPTPSRFTLMAVLEQNILPNAPRCADIVHYQTRSMDDMARAIRLTGASVLGIATGPPTTQGLVSCISIATTQKIFCLTISNTALPDHANGSNKAGYRALFNPPQNEQILVGFEMAHLIPIISTTVGCPVSGIDLSMMGACADIKLSPFKSPGEFVNSIIPSARSIDINRYLEFYNEDDDEGGVCRKAWISAM